LFTGLLSRKDSKEREKGAKKNDSKLDIRKAMPKTRTFSKSLVKRRNDGGQSAYLKIPKSEIKKRPVESA